MKIYFDEIIERRNTTSVKWRAYPQDVLPMWVADMDFATPEPIMEAIQQHLQQKILGYGIDDPELKEVLVGHLSEKYNWKVTEEDIVFIPGVVAGFNLAALATAKDHNSKVFTHTPVYPPFLSVGNNTQTELVQQPLVRDGSGKYLIDFAAFKNQLDRKTSLYILCNPENPTGRCFTEAELSKLAETCLSNGTTICSDEIHCDLLLPGSKHIPIAALDQEVSKRTITLMSPSKSFNIPGLFFAFAVIQNPDLRKAFLHSAEGITGHTTSISQSAAKSAYSECDDWLNQCLAYLNENRLYLENWLKDNAPMLKVTPAEATYLAWIDCSELRLDEPAAKFFLEKGKVAVNAGETFGKGNENFIRLNFGCTRSTLIEGLERIGKAIRG